MARGALSKGGKTTVTGTVFERGGKRSLMFAREQRGYYKSEDLPSASRGEIGHLSLSLPKPSGKKGVTDRIQLPQTCEKKIGE